MTSAFFFRILGVFLIMLSVFIIWYSWKDINIAIDTKQNGIKTIGTIVRIDYVYKSSPPDQILVVEFKNKNNVSHQYRYEKLTRNWTTKRIGEKTELIYSPNNPSCFWLTGDINKYILRNVLGVIFIIIMGFFFIFFSKNISLAISNGSIEIGD